MTAWHLSFLGVGNAAAPQLGSASVVLEKDDAPLLMIDCGQEALSACLERYGRPPPAVFVTHVHLDHVAGFERLFVANHFGNPRPPRTRLFVPAMLVPLLQGRVADYPNVVAEGAVNFWDAFDLVPVSYGFWHQSLWFDVFPVRHHVPGTAYGLCLPGTFLYTGDTRPIPETIAQFADGTAIRPTRACPTCSGSTTRTCAGRWWCITMHRRRMARPWRRRACGWPGRVTGSPSRRRGKPPPPMRPPCIGACWATGATGNTDG